MTTYFDANELILVRVKINFMMFAGHDTRNYELYLDAGINGVDVRIAFETIQFETDVDVSPSSSICSPVNSHSGSFSVVDRSGLTPVQLFPEVVGESQIWHFTQHLGAVHVPSRHFARLQNTN